jgi:hypothetical protein
MASVVLLWMKWSLNSAFRASAMSCRRRGLQEDWVVYESVHDLIKGGKVKGELLLSIRDGGVISPPDSCK